MTDTNPTTHRDAEHLETLDRDLGRLSDVEETAFAANRAYAAPAIAGIFILAAGLLAMLFFGGGGSTMIVVAASNPQNATSVLPVSREIGRQLAGSMPATV